MIPKFQKANVLHC